MMLSQAFRAAARNSINALKNNFGVFAKIYFPKGYSSGRGGYDSEIVFNEKPDWEGKLLAPFVFQYSKVHFAGFYDLYNGDEKVIYLDCDFKIYINSKVVLEMQGGEEAFIVSEIDGHNDDLGKIYQKVIVVPYNKFEDYKTLDENNKLKIIELNDEEIDLDILTDDFDEKLNHQKELEEIIIEKTENSLEINENEEKTEIIDNYKKTNYTSEIIDNEKNVNISKIGIID